MGDYITIGNVINVALLWSSHYHIAQNCIEFLAHLGQYRKNLWKKLYKEILSLLECSVDCILTLVVWEKFMDCKVLKNQGTIIGLYELNNTWSCEKRQKESTKALLVKDKYHMLNEGKWFTKRKSVQYLLQ